MKWNFAFHELWPFIQILKVQIFYKTRALHFYSSKPETFLLRSSALLLSYFIWRCQSFKNNISCFFSFLFFSFFFFFKEIFYLIHLKCLHFNVKYRRKLPSENSSKIQLVHKKTVMLPIRSKKKKSFNVWIFPSKLHLTNC